MEALQCQRVFARHFKMDDGIPHAAAPLYLAFSYSALRS